MQGADPDYLPISQNKEEGSLTQVGSGRTPAESWKWYTNSLRQCSLLTGTHTLMEGEGGGGRKEEKKRRMKTNYINLFKLSHSSITTDSSCWMWKHQSWCMCMWLNMTRIRWEILTVQFAHDNNYSVCVCVCIFCVQCLYFMYALCSIFCCWNV